MSGGRFLKELRKICTQGSNNFMEIDLQSEYCYLLSFKIKLLSTKFLSISSN